MPSFRGVQGDVHYRQWVVENPIASYVFLHGFGEHSGLYQRFAVALNDAGIDLWALDQIGHGKTEGTRGLIESLDDLVENGHRLTGLAEAHRPDLPLVLAGHSLGGVAAALTIARDPDPFVGAVLSGTPLVQPAWVAELATSRESELVLTAGDLSSDPWYVEALATDPLIVGFEHLARTLGGTLPPAWAELESTLEQVLLPILLVHGADDAIAPVDDARAWSRRLRDGSLVEFAGARHDVLNEVAYADVAASIVRFVRQFARPHASV